MTEHADFFTNKNILVTGGCGYLGYSVVRALSQFNCRITVADKVRDPSLPDGARADIRYEQADITAEDCWPSLLRERDIIFHFAAQTSAYKANAEPLADLAVNVLPVIRLVDACRSRDLCPAILFAGTATQVGVTDRWPVNETFADRPITVYDIHKLAAEKYLLYYATQLGGRAAVLRLANVYGPGPQSGSPDRGIVNMMVNKALAGQPLTVYGDGEFIRDYIFIDDVVRAFLSAAVNIQQVSGRYFVIGTGRGWRIADMVGCIQNAVRAMTGTEAEVKHVPLPEGLSAIEFRNFVADSAAFSEATGWKSDVGLENGIARTIEFFRKGYGL